MVWIILSILVLVGFAVCLVVGLSYRSSERRLTQEAEKSTQLARERLDFIRQAKEAGEIATIFGWIVMIATIFWILISAWSSIHAIEAGHVGVVYQFGGIIGQRPEGFQLIAPWQDLQIWDIRTQRIRSETKCFDGKIPDCLEAFSAETQDVFIQATVNLSVDPDDVQTLARTVGRNYVEKLVLPRLHQITKDITVRYRSVDIAPNREEIREKIRDRMKNELAERSINIEDLLIDNMDFRPEFKQAIEAKQIASQEALRQQELVAAKAAEARQKAAEAEGNAQKLRIEAQGQADANRAINESLTPLLIQFQALQKLSDKIQIALIPSGQGIIIDPATLLGGEKR